MTYTDQLTFEEDFDKYFDEVIDGVDCWSNEALVEYVKQDLLDNRNNMSDEFIIAIHDIRGGF